MWTFEPSVARKIFGAWIETNRIGVVYGERLDRASGVALTRSVPWRILSVRMESGRVFRGKVFIDATYEGDLMAAAKVSYTVGREANALYGETLNGIQVDDKVYLSPLSDPNLRIEGRVEHIGAQINPAWGVLAGHVVFLAILAVKPTGLISKGAGS